MRHCQRTALTLDRGCRQLMQAAIHSSRRREIRSGPPDVPGAATNPGTRTNQTRETCLGDVGLTARLPVYLVLNGCESEALGFPGGAGISKPCRVRLHRWSGIGGPALLAGAQRTAADAWPIRPRSAGSCTFKAPPAAGASFCHCVSNAGASDAADGPPPRCACKPGAHRLSSVSGCGDRVPPPRGPRSAAVTRARQVSGPDT